MYGAWCSQSPFSEKRTGHYAITLYILFLEAIVSCSGQCISTQHQALCSTDTSF